MKPLLPIVLVLATTAAVAQQTSVPPSAPNAAQGATVNQGPNAQKARALLQQAIQALGGQAYLSYTDMEQQGRTYGFYHGETRGGGLPFWRFWKAPDRDRYEFTKERDIVQIFTGNTANEVTFKGVGNVDAEQLADYRRRLPFSIENILRHWVSDSTVAFFDEGAAVANAKPAEKVTLINAQNQSVTIFLDTDTHLPIRKTFQWRDPADREFNEEAESWDNYRPIQGIMTPHSITRYHNGEIVNQRFLTTITYNQGLPDSLFDPQVAAKEVAKRK